MDLKNNKYYWTSLQQARPVFTTYQIRKEYMSISLRLISNVLLSTDLCLLSNTLLDIVTYTPVFIFKFISTDQTLLLNVLAQTYVCYQIAITIE